MFIFYYFLWQCVSHLKASFSSYQHRQGNLNTSCKLLIKPSIVTNTVWFRYNPPPPHSVSCWVTRVGGASSACWGGRGWPTMWSPATRGSTSQTSASCFSPSRWLNKIVGSTQKTLSWARANFSALQQRQRDNKAMFYSFSDQQKFGKC